MPENPLIALAAAMRTALSQPVAADDKAAQMARLDLIDMIPDLQRSLIGEQAFIRDLTWQVNCHPTLLEIVDLPDNISP